MGSCRIDSLVFETNSDGLDLSNERLVLKDAVRFSSSAEGNEVAAGVLGKMTVEKDGYHT